MQVPGLSLPTQLRNDMSIESFLRTVLVIAVAGVECASASRTGYIVDCVSANSIQSYFAYHNNETPYSQTKPDAAVAINPSSGLNAYNSDISVPGLGSVSLAISQD